MQDYPKESGRGCFFAGLIFALVLGECGYWMLHKETLTVEKAAPRKPNIAVLDAKAKPHFNLANQIERSVNSGNFYPNETGLVNVPMLTVARNGGKKWD